MNKNINVIEEPDDARPRSQYYRVEFDYGLKINRMQRRGIVYSEFTHVYTKNPPKIKIGMCFWSGANVDATCTPIRYSNSGRQGKYIDFPIFV